MTLDDRSLREHLDRRAGTGSSEPVRIADAVIDRIGTGSAEPWWRGSRAHLPGFAMASAVVVVVLLAAALAPSLLRPSGPGSSSPGTSVTGPAGTGYPGADALDAAGLAALLGDDPAVRASILVIADVQIQPIRRLCTSQPCADDGIAIPGTDRFIPVVVPPDLRGAPSPYAFRVQTDGTLQLLGPVRGGPSRLAWSFDELTADLTAIRQADAAWRQLYLVESRLSIDPGQRYCALQIPPLPSPWFGCGSYVAWLQPLDASYPPSEPPADGVRVPNVPGWRERSDALFEAGYFLIDPTASVQDCFLCGPLGAADLLGRVLPAAELGAAGPPKGPQSTLQAPAGSAYPALAAMNADELAAWLGTDPAARAGAVAIADVDLVPTKRVCADDQACPAYVIETTAASEIQVLPSTGASAGAAPYAFRVGSGGSLELLGSVMPGGDGLAWSLPALIGELPQIRGGGGGDAGLYLVDAWLATAQVAYPCPQPIPTPSSVAFVCSNGQAWLVPDQASVPATPEQMPPNGMRLPNIVAFQYPYRSTGTKGYWLIDPSVGVDQCFMCPPAGAVGFLGQVLPLDGGG